MKTDIEIAQNTPARPILEVAQKLHISSQDLEFYGNNKAKISYRFIKETENRVNGKLILVTAMSPTPMGEGKTTMSVGLADGLAQLGKSVIATLREPSLGPVFGMKGGATGGGYAQVIPMEEINLHFTGDLHAISAANNLLAAMLDNHIFQGNTLNIDPRTITWKRVLDINDRQLRNIVSGLNGKNNGVPREDGFNITVASEIMAILCLAKDLDDLKKRIGNIVLGYTFNGDVIHARELNCQGAVSTLLKDALKPNLVQTLEGTPVFIHGGPFANIAHGCNSVMATQLALKLADYVVTEAGFGADLGAEKFLDIKCREANIKPDACVVVATIRALKYHGGVTRNELEKPNLDAIREGIKNLSRHIDNLTQVYGLPTIVTINPFPSDTQEELDLVRSLCQKEGVQVIVNKAWAKGGKGATALAEGVIKLCEEKSHFQYAYACEEPIIAKIETIARRIYRCHEVIFDKKALDKISKYEQQGFKDLPICIAKTPYSFSSDATLLGAPIDANLYVNDVNLCAGAGFIVVLTGNVLTMPGLPKVPAAERIDIDNNGVITGLS
ncbi:formate--tetrahydrofolate ligase [Actinobacillus delphinicola]|uniref:formate--tetrahydrofolate ligase n=1 Tax=Actinobacillus delphinicola TaxID=51161 RepID=UPI00244165A9|nr:formate--tetrahydrofolate ligase [Actinobacillus delphinicola]MDG6897013.1 formate--tetrahydrofolate ligase [Actinobacillus delphinicola]